MFTLDFSVSLAPRMRNPRQRWNAGLERAGLNFRQSLQRSHYPPIPPNSTYNRTYNTADKAGFRIIQEGVEMEFGSTEYLRFLFMPAETVQNWQGKREFAFEQMVNGFRSGVRDFGSDPNG